MTVDYDDGILSFSEPSSFSKKRPNHIAIENRSEVVQNFTLGLNLLLIDAVGSVDISSGSFHVAPYDVDEDERPFQPFAMIESVKYVSNHETVS